jgi:hypothetical protein
MVGFIQAFNIYTNTLKSIACSVFQTYFWLQITLFMGHTVIFHRPG